MKKVVVLAICLLAISGFSVNSHAGEGIETHGTLLVNYWMADFSTNGGEDGDLKYFPSVMAIVSFSPHWSVIGEYSDSDSVVTNLEEEVSSQRYLVGFRYDFESGMFLNMSYTNMEYDLVDLSTGDTGSLNIDGIRLGAGFEGQLADSPWSVLLELGYSVDPSGNFEQTGVGSASTDADEYDIEVRFSYMITDSGLLGNFGYKYIKTEVGDVIIDTSGFFLGVGYDW